MKKIFYVAMIIGLISCDQNENGTHSAALGANATAGLDESVIISDVSAAITPFNITIVEIMDSVVR